MRRPVHPPFTIAALVAAMVVLFGLVASGARLHLPVREEAARPAEPAVTAEDVASAERLSAAFSRLNYRLDAVAGGNSVPRVVVGSMPADLDRIDQPDARKDVFLRLMLPLVLVADEEVAADRRHLEALARAARAGAHLSPREEAWLRGLAFRYDLDPGPRLAERLLARVDVVPPSLALAQAALETGWGTSRQARRGKNLFGQNREDDGKVLGQARFATLLEAVRAYVHNLNTHRAYRGFREARARMRTHGATPDGLTLATTITAYSELGRDYVADVQSVIRGNGLGRFDAARLDGPVRTADGGQGI